MKIIAILAPKQSGKSSITNYLVKNYNFIEYGFADAGKRGLQQMFGFSNEQLWGTEEQKETIDPRWGISARRMMQIALTELFQFDIQKYLKPEEEAFKVIGRKIWVHKFKLWFEEQEKLHKQNFIEAKVAGLVKGEIPEFNVIVSDTRFPHECDIIKEMGGEIWRVSRPSKVSNDTHISETEHQAILPDKLIINDGTLEDLYKKIELYLHN